MRLIGLAVVLAVGLTLAPLAAKGQQAGTIYRIGLITVTHIPGEEAFFERLRELGYVEGQNLVTERRYSEGRAERFPEFAAELVRLKVDIIIVGTTPAALAVKDATKTIPVVFPTAIDPVGAGVVASLARPGGNITGLTTQAPDLVPRPRLARDVLHDGHGAFADECDRHRVGAHAVARDAARGVGALSNAEEVVSTD
jgi:putative ABC transport system substrate-binding protein